MMDQETKIVIGGMSNPKHAMLLLRLFADCEEADQLGIAPHRVDGFSVDPYFNNVVAAAFDMTVTTMMLVGAAPALKERIYAANHQYFPEEQIEYLEEEFLNQVDLDPERKSLILPTLVSLDVMRMEEDPDVEEMELAVPRYFQLIDMMFLETYLAAGMESQPVIDIYKKYRETQNAYEDELMRPYLS